MGIVVRGATGVLCAALGITGTIASAQEKETVEIKPSKSYFSAMPFGVVQDRDRAIFDDDGLGARLLYGQAIDRNWHWEVQAAYNNLETGIGGYTDYYQYHLGVDFTYRFGDQQGLTPFILAGLGAVRDDVFPLGNRPDDDETSFFANAGFGVVSGELGDSGVRIRGEARYVHSEFADGFEDTHIGIGFEIPLGRTKVVTRTVTETREVTREVPAPAQPPADSDSDGVVDGVDRCPNTLAGAKVDQHGCAVKEQTIQIEGVFFELNSDELKAESRRKLQEVADFLKNQPELRVVIAGHTDSQGDAQYNQQLSQARADSVKFFLIRQGIDPARLDARGFGENQPIASNATAAGRAMNRRVEFRIQR